MNRKKVHFFILIIFPLFIQACFLTEHSNSYQTNQAEKKSDAQTNNKKEQPKPDKKKFENNKPKTNSKNNGKKVQTSSSKKQDFKQKPKTFNTSNSNTKRLNKKIVTNPIEGETKPIDNKSAEKTHKKDSDVFKPSKTSTAVEQPKNQVAQNTTVLLSNDYFTIKKIDEKKTYEINQPIKAPTFLDENGNATANTDVNSITKEQMENTSYILLPLDHWFVKATEDRPFAQLPNIVLPRTNIYGFSLKALEKTSEGVLYEKSEAINPPKKADYASLDADTFNSFFANINNRLGKGTYGEVFSFSHDGKDYALKKQILQFEIDEFYNLELLQFTNAVAKVYGSFCYEGKLFIIMEKGEKSLDKVIANKEKLNDTILLESAKRMQYLSQAYQKLNIENNDIKPHNMILTDDGIKTIDISVAKTYGYEGSPGNKAALSLINIYAKKQISHPRDLFERYYSVPQTVNFLHKTFIYWLREIANHLSLPINLDTINNFDNLYYNLSQENLLEMFKRVDDRDKKICPYLNRTWKTDPLSQEIYPQLLKKEEIEWSLYFNKIDILKRVFINNINYEEDIFNTTLKSKYQNKLIKIGDHYELNIDFDNKNSEEFHEWVFDVYEPHFKYTVYGLLGTEFKEIDPFPSLIRGMLEDQNYELYLEISKLYNS